MGPGGSYSMTLGVEARCLGCGRCRLAELDEAERKSKRVLRDESETGVFAIEHPAPCAQCGKRGVRVRVTFSGNES